jgi:hypothetical protein
MKWLEPSERSTVKELPPLTALAYHDQETDA